MLVGTYVDLPLVLTNPNAALQIVFSLSDFSQKNYCEGKCSVHTCIALILTLLY